MAKTPDQRRQRGSIRPHGKGFEVRVYAGRDPLTKKDIYLTEEHPTWDLAERARVRLLHQVDEQRAPKSDVTVDFILDRWLSVAEMDPSTRERVEAQIRLYLRPTFGAMKARKLTAEALELFYGRLRRCSQQCDGKRSRSSRTVPACRPPVRAFGRRRGALHAEIDPCHWFTTPTPDPTWHARDRAAPP